MVNSNFLLIVMGGCHCLLFVSTRVSAVCPFSVTTYYQNSPCTSVDFFKYQIVWLHFQSFSKLISYKKTRSDLECNETHELLVYSDYVNWTKNINTIKESTEDWSKSKRRENEVYVRVSSSECKTSWCSLNSPKMRQEQWR